MIGYNNCIGMCPPPPTLHWPSASAVATSLGSVSSHPFIQSIPPTELLPVGVYPASSSSVVYARVVFNEKGMSTCTIECRLTAKQCYIRRKCSNQYRTSISSTETMVARVHRPLINQSELKKLACLFYNPTHALFTL
jgi:hypothetical protein